MSSDKYSPVTSLGGQAALWVMKAGLGGLL